MMGTETPTVINSLTSNRKGGSRKNNTTSLAEALATTVADYMCEGGGNASSALRKNGEIFTNPLNSPSSAMAPLNSNNLPGASEMSKGRNMPPPPPRSASTTGICENNISQNINNNGSSATSTITTTANGSSMGSNIEDLASVCNFRQQTSSSSAPIISGTAAEVLALQSALRDYSSATTNTSGGAVVSNPSSVESPISPPASTSSSNSSLARNTSDGAPMISGTAAAQMAMIATAAKITENGGGHSTDVANNANSHDAGLHRAFVHGSGLDVDAVASLKVGHHDNLRQISPEDFSSSSVASTTIGNSSLSGSNHWNQTRPLHVKSASTATKGGAGGMDILAEITCHAPPMPLFQQHYQQAPSDSTSPYHQQMYHQVKHRVSGIPSYQEIYREMGQQQQQSSATSAFHQHHEYRVESVDDISNNTAQKHSTTIRFGHPPSRDLLEEGKDLYTRKDLITYGGHLCENKDVHGNMKDGCDSIVIANLVSVDCGHSGIKALEIHRL